MMSHILDNPIYNALISGNNNFAKGTENVKYFKEDMAAFAGLKNNSKANFDELYQLSDVVSLFVIFSIIPLEIPKEWELLHSFNMYQMVYEKSEEVFTKSSEIVNLRDENVQQMKDLVELTKPGPFLDRTIDFENYTGLFDDGKLISMAGHRFNPIPYREISAVCTDTQHLGKGYASILLKEQIYRIIKREEIPFLHVRSEKDGAIKLYQKLGFEIRTNIIGYVIKKV